MHFIIQGELMQETNKTHHCIGITREHSDLNRGQSDLQSDALPLSYAPCNVMILRKKKCKTTLKNKLKMNILTFLDCLHDAMSFTELKECLIVGQSYYYRENDKKTCLSSHVLKTLNNLNMHRNTAAPAVPPSITILHC